MADYTTISFLKAAPNTSVANDDAALNEALTPVAGNLATTIVATSDNNILRLATNRDVLVSLGTAPNATSDAGRFLVPAGNVEWRAVRTGYKVAIALA